LDGPTVIITLKIAVVAVTILLVASLVALARGHVKWHGRINFAFFGLTLAAVLGLEVIIRFLDPTIFDYILNHEELRQGLNVHLCFSVPALLLMPAMLYTGLTRRRWLHLSLAVLFGVAWAGTFITGVFFLPVGRDG
jgi:hypothetical protein